MFSQEALLKLKQIAGAFFTTAEQGKDPAITTSITKIVPDSGPSSGGTPVTITGTGFATGSQVNFGGVPATAVNVVSGTQLTRSEERRVGKEGRSRWSP